MEAASDGESDMRDPVGCRRRLRKLKTESVGKQHPTLDQLTETELGRMQEEHMKMLAGIAKTTGHTQPSAIPTYALLNTLRRDHHILKQCCGRHPVDVNGFSLIANPSAGQRRHKGKFKEPHPAENAVALYRLRLASTLKKQTTKDVLKMLGHMFGSAKIKTSDSVTFQHARVCLSCWAAIHGVSKSKIYGVVKKHNSW